MKRYPWIPLNEDLMELDTTEMVESVWPRPTGLAFGNHVVEQLVQGQVLLPVDFSVIADVNQFATFVPVGFDPHLGTLANYLVVLNTCLDQSTEGSPKEEGILRTVVECTEEGGRMSRVQGIGKGIRMAETEYGRHIRGWQCLLLFLWSKKNG